MMMMIIIIMIMIMIMMMMMMMLIIVIISIQFSSVHFSSRWYLNARKSPYALKRRLRKVPPLLPLNETIDRLPPKD